MTKLDDAMQVIRPRLRGHAGDMRAELDDDGTVRVHFEGACQTCPSIALTYAGLVRTTLLDVPGVHRVVADQVHASPRSLNRIAAMLGAPPVDDQ